MRMKMILLSEKISEFSRMWGDDYMSKYLELYDYLLSEIGSSTMDLVDDWLDGKGKLPTYDMGSDAICVAYELKALKGCDNT